MKRIRNLKFNLVFIIWFILILFSKNDLKIQEELRSQSPDSKFIIGNLDISFGNKGKVITDINENSGDSASDVIIQPDRKILVIGNSNKGGINNFALVRYNPDGSLDQSFGNKGIVITDIFPEKNYEQVAKAAKLQTDGKIVVMGDVYYKEGIKYDFVVVRYNSDGSLDRTFGKEGIVITNLGFASRAYSLELQEDGKILVVGTSNFDFALVRYNPDGSLDQNFGNNGIVITDINKNFNGTAYAITVQPDGKILVGGNSIEGNKSFFAILRYNSNGSLDINFANQGIFKTDIPSGGIAYSIALQKDGKILIAGESKINDYPKFVVFRLNSNGKLDSSFGKNGVVITDINNSWDYARKLILQKDGKFLVVGYTYKDSITFYNFAIVRYNPDGSLDQSFGKNGKVVTDINSGSGDYALSAELQKDNKLIVVGESNNDFAVLRYE